MSNGMNIDPVSISLLDECVNDVRHNGVKNPVIVMSRYTWDEFRKLYIPIDTDDMKKMWLFGCRVLLRDELAEGQVRVMNPLDLP